MHGIWLIKKGSGSSRILSLNADDMAAFRSSFPAATNAECSRSPTAASRNGTRKSGLKGIENLINLDPSMSSNTP